MGKYNDFFVFKNNRYMHLEINFSRTGLEDLSSEDEAVASDLDMHALILSSPTDNCNMEEPVKTADEVLKEIDDIMQESPLSDASMHSESLIEMNEAIERSKEVLSSPLHEKRTIFNCNSK